MYIAEYSAWYQTDGKASESVTVNQYDSIAERDAAFNVMVRDAEILEGTDIPTGAKIDNDGTQAHIRWFTAASPVRLFSLQVITKTDSHPIPYELRRF